MSDEYVDATDDETLDEHQEEEEQDDLSEDQDVEDESEDEQDPIADLRKEYDAKLAGYQTKLDESQKEINRLGYALRTASKKPETKDNSGFSDAQLLEIYNEHKDDPQVAFQVLKELAKNVGKDVETNAEKKAEIVQQKKQVEGYLDRTWPTWKEEGSEVHKHIQKTKSELFLDDHPLGDFLAMASMEFRRIPMIIKQVHEYAKKEALENKAEKGRKDKIHNGKPDGTTSKPSKSKAVSLSQTEEETAKKLGLDPKKYAKFIKGARGGSVMVA